MKIFVAGATGVIGRQLLPMLLTAGYDVAGSTRKQEGVEAIRRLGARSVLVDVYDRATLFGVLQVERPDVVLDMLTDLQGGDFVANDRLRVEGTPNLVDAALAAGVRRMIAESLAFAYVPGTGPAAEEDALDVDAPAPRGPLAAGVQALERAVSRMPEHVVLRYGLLYGPGTWRAPGGRVAEQVRRGELAATDGVASFLHVADAARAALLALDWPSSTLNIVDDEPAPVREWLPAIAEMLGARPPFRLPAWIARLVAGAHLVAMMTQARAGSNQKAKRVLGWQPAHPSWRQGFAEVIAQGDVSRPPAAAA
jgi:nucleoside-diphosphate-sugar epimerase